MAKADKVKTSEVVEVEVPEEEIYTGNVYEFNGGLTVSNNTGPVTITINMQGIPNNYPPK
jgi:hypothetical protein